jgi:site-specific DNA recombinase
MLGIYTRLSREKEDSNSIKNQLREGVAFAKAKGIDYEIFNEGEGVSGADPLNKRPELSRLMSVIESGKITSVWFRNQDRLERNNVVFGSFAELAKKKKLEVYFADQRVDYTNPQHALTGTILSGINQYFREIQSEKTRKSLRDNIKEGRVHGLPPYGYVKDQNRHMVICESQALIVKRIFDLSLQGIGTNSIAEILNKDGVPTKLNNYAGTLTTRSGVKIPRKQLKWAGGTIRNIIVNPIYMGKRFFGEKLNRKEFESPIIIEPRYWQKVNDNLKKNANNSGKKVEHKYLLKGIIKCGRCGRNYYGRSRQNKRDHYYTCSSKRRGVENCGNRSINIDFIEGLIWEHFFSQGLFRERLQDYFKQLESEPRIKEIEEQTKNYNAIIKEQTEQKKELVRLAAKGVLEEEDIAQEMKTIRTAINDAEIHLQRLSEQKSSYNSLSDNAETINGNLMSIENANISFKEKSDFLKEYLSRTVIHFDQPTEHYFIEIIPKIEGMDKIVFVAPYSKKFAYEYVHENVLVHGYDGQSYYKDFTPDHLLIQGFDATFERIFGMTMEEHLKNFDFSQCDLPPSDRELNA